MATTFKQHTNNAASTLATGIDDNDLTIVVATGEGGAFPGSGAFWVTLYDDDPTDGEIVLIDSRATDTLTVNASGRGAQGTSATAWVAGVNVALFLTKAAVEQMQTAINGIENGSTTLTSVTASGTVTGADLVATDDLTVGDDASVAGDLTVVGTVTGGDLVATDDLTVGDAATITGALSCASVNVASGGALTALKSGTFTPSITNVANIASVGNKTGGYVEVGLQVFGWFYIEIVPTAGSTLTEFRCALPVASNLSTQRNAIAHAHVNATTNTNAFASGNATNDDLDFSFTSTGTGTHTLRGTFGYLKQ